MATPPTPAHANTVGWYILEGYPWWPVYICDQFKLRAHLYQLGDGHKKILKKAKDFHRDYALVYYFGSHDFSLVKLNKGILKPWECSEKDQYVKGHPKHLMKKGGVADDLSIAVQEVEDYLSQPEDMRLPPHMVPSDLDPTLEPPPPMERPEDVEDEEDGASDADGGDGEDDEDADADMDHDDDDGDDGEKKAKKTKKETKKKPAAKKEKAEKEKKPKKEKKEKEKKPPKEKKEKKTPTKEKKEPAAKKKSEPKEKATKLKRQRSSGGDDDADAGAEESGAAKPKQPKKDKAADVKSPSTTGESENLEEVLEREIRWILSNEQYEEMTTKMLRKVLEERLKRDLKQHRDTIKAVVTRVIEEEEDAADAQAAGGEDNAPDGEKSDADGDVKMEEAEPVKKEEPTPEPSETGKAETEAGKSDAHAEEEPVKEEKAEKVEEQGEPEAADDEQEKNEAPPPPPPKPVEEADILAIKDKLLDDKTSHEELLSSLNELQLMPLEFKHLKRTGIPRVVAKLRQHANDKVSIAAKDLRNAWMQLVEKDKQPTNLKELEKLRDTLEAEGESEASKLGVLKELDKLSLSTQEIIDAKIGVTISKLRKSSHADLAQAANKLRQKWKKQAEAARPQ